MHANISGRFLKSPKHLYIEYFQLKYLLITLLITNNTKPWDDTHIVLKLTICKGPNENRLRFCLMY